MADGMLTKPIDRTRDVFLEGGDGMMERARDLLTTTQDAVRTGSTRALRTVKDHPVAASAVAAGIALVAVGLCWRYWSRQS